MEDNVLTTAQDENIRKIFIFDFISSAALLFISFIVSFVPIVKIGSSSLGNTWQVLAKLPELLKGGGETVTLSAAMANLILLIPAAITVSVLLLSAVDLALAFVCKNNERFHYSTRGPLSLGITLLAIIAIGAIFFIVAASDLGKWYGVGLHAYILLPILLGAKISGGIVFKTVMTNRSPEKIEEYRSFKTVEPHIAMMRLSKSIFDTPLTFGIIAIVILSLTLRGTLPSLLLHMPDGYQVREITSQNASDIYQFQNNDGFILTKQNASSASEYFYSSNYQFYESFIKSTEKKIKEMYPEALSAEAFEKYVKDCEVLKKDIELAKELRDNFYYVYEDMYYKSKYSDDYYFSVRQRLNMTAGKSSVNPKWETREDPLAYEKGESVTLSRTSFTTTTDFSKIQLCAYITYKDGSKQYTLITIDNAAELNAAPSGTHTLRFHDDWGSYGVAITIN